MSEEMPTNNTTYMEGYAQRERDALREELKQEVLAELRPVLEAAQQRQEQPAPISGQSQTELCKQLGWTSIRLRNFLLRNNLEGVPVGNAKLYDPQQVRKALRKENAKMLAYINIK